MRKKNQFGSNGSIRECSKVAQAKAKDAARSPDTTSTTRHCANSFNTPYKSTVLVIRFMYSFPWL
jgi:hypothetical protein